MAVNKYRIEEIFDQLPEELHEEVLSFAKSLLEEKSETERDVGTQTVTSFFGSWDSGSSNSADNDRIDRDLTHELLKRSRY
jgi:hypothetical protein